MLLLVAPALAALAADLPPGAPTVSMLVCPADDTCDDDAAWVDGAVGAAPFVRLDLLLERDNGGWVGGADTRAALADALADAEAAAAKGRWGAVASAVDAAERALAVVKGDVNAQALFTLWFLDGAAAVARGEDRGHEYSFRQAAAIAAVAAEAGEDVHVPPHDEAVARAWADERRKLVVGGEGTVSLAAPAGTRWSVDGAALDGAGATEVRLLPGNHRLVATRAGSVRSWQGDVPVLAGRTVAVSATFPPTESAAWLQARLDDAFDTLQGPPELTRLLGEWARRHDLAAVRLLRVDTRDLPRPAPLAFGAADPLRPAAADGERVDHGDGIPSTYAEEVIAVDADARPRADAAERRLRVIWFDPALERFSLDASPTLPRADLAEPRFRVGVHLGYAGLMAHHHATVDLGGAWRLASLAGGPVELDARLGLARADAPYNLYAGWIDQQLYHASLGVRWAPDRDIAPFVAVGPELYVPVAFGARLATGAQVRIERRWLAVAEVHGGWLDQGPAWGAGLSLARMY